MTEVTSELRVFMRHVRAAGGVGICAPGVLDFFERNPHLRLLDLSDRKGKGIPASDLLAANDLFATRCVAAAEKEARNG